VDSRNAEAVTYGPEYMLGKFANLPDKQGDSKPAEEFQQQYGELFPGLSPQDYWIDVFGFRNAWHARTRHQLDVVSEYLTKLLNRSLRPHVKEPQNTPTNKLAVLEAVLGRDPRYYPALKVDFSDGKIKSAPSVTLLDWLANALLECRHRLGMCEREGCATPYFVKTHPRGRYCSEACFRASRQEKKNQWWKQNRGIGTKPITGKRTRGKSKKSGMRGER
jgi:hypothetical protein